MVEFTAGTTERTGTESPTANVPYLDFPGDLIFQLAASYVPANNEGKLDYQITGGADAGLFTIVNDVLGEENWANLILHGENWSGSGGRVDYETNLAFGGGTYAVDVTVTSTLNGAQSTGSFFITVLDYSIVSWTTNFISGGGNPLAVTNVINGSIEEGVADGTELFDVEATDGSGSPVYSLSADSSNGAFEIDAVTGIVSVANGSLINFENNGNYTITVKATENANDFVTRDFTIGSGIVSVTDVAPSTPVDNDTDDNEVFENTADATVGVMAFATDVAGGDVRYSVTDSRFVIDEVTGIVKVAPDGFPLGLDFETTPSIDLEVTASTVNGAEVSKQTFTINVLDGNDAPVMYQQNSSSDENQTSAGMVAATDEDNDTLTYELTGAGADASFFTIDENTGELSFKAAQDFEAPNDADEDGTYAVEVKVNDGNGGSRTETVFVVLADKNEAPEIAQTAFNASENIAGAADVFAADPDSGDSIEYTITGGADDALFTISKTTGFLDFLSAPNFENKIDADTDGVYEVEVTATDSGGLTDTQLVKITVKNENDAPQITSTTFDAEENDKTVGPLTVTDQDPGDTTFKNFFVTGGADMALFEVDFDTGVLSFLSAPDFENKIDADTDGVYEVEVSVADQHGTPGSQTILVTVTDELIEPGVTITGTAGVDTIDLTKTVIGQPLPTTGDDTIFGLAGNDVIDGGAGDDEVSGGAGMDILFGNAGADELDGGADADTVTYVNSGKGVTIALDGLAGTGGDAAGDKLTGIENLVGSTQADRLTGNSSINKIEGGLGNDTIAGGGGNDTLDGGTGFDTLDYSYVSGAVLTVTLGAWDKNTLKTVAASTSGITGDVDSFMNFEAVIGGQSGSKLTGNAGDNSLFGGAGDDTLEGLGGADMLDGQGGANTITYGKSAFAVTVDLSLNNNADVSLSGTQKGGDAKDDRLANVDIVIGSSFADSLKGSSEAETFIGGVGADAFDGNGGIDTVSYANEITGVIVNLTLGTGLGGNAAGDTLANIDNLIGTKGADVLTGDSDQNFIYGADGNDMIDGGSNADELVGGLGIDTLSYANSTGTVIVDLSTQGTSLVNGEKNTAVATQNSGEADGDLIWGFENLTGGKNGDILSGDAGVNVINGGLGNDSIRGGGANDTLDGGAGFDTLDYSYVSGAGVTVTLGAWDKNTLTTAAASTSGVTGDIDSFKNFEAVIGGQSGSKLTGNAGDNTFFGGAGDDTLEGLGGADMLDGQGGANTITYGKSDFAVTVDLSLNNNADVSLSGTQLGGHAAGDRLANVRVLIGSASNDVLKGSIANETFIGGAGKDAFHGGGGVDTVTYATVTGPITINLTTNVNAGGEALGDTFTNIQNIIATTANDILTGDGAANYLFGGNGNDTIEGGGGADELVGGLHIDTLTYANSAAGVTVRLNEQGVSFANSGSKDTPGLPQSGGDADGDLLWGFENIIGSAANDTLGGDAGVNTMQGGAGIDSITGFGGTDALDGGAGIDTVDYSYLVGGKNVTVTLGALDTKGNVAQTSASGVTGDLDTLKNFENITGGAGNDKLTGNAGDNVFKGGAGADLFVGGAGADTFYGNAANNDKGDIGDTVDYAASDTGVLITIIGNDFSIAGIGGHAEGDLLAGINAIIGSNFNDVLLGDVVNDVFAVTLSGGAGDDRIGSVGNASGTNVLDGGTHGAAGDTIDYSWASDTVTLTIALSNTNALVNVDSTNGDAGTTQIKNFENIIGGAGDDILTGNNVANFIEGGEGADKLVGGLGTDTVSYAGSANGVSVSLTKQGTSNADGSKNGAADAQTGGTGDSVGDELWGFENILGSAKNDSLAGNGEINKIEGGSGDDTVAGLGKNDGLDGGAGIDTLDYSYLLAGQNLVLTLGAADVSGNVAQTSTSGVANDADTVKNFENIVGGAGDDKLTGNAGDNVLRGGAGTDILIGGLGADQLFGNSSSVDLANKGDVADYSASNAGISITLSAITFSAAGKGGHAEGDTLAGINNINGSGFNDFLSGDTGNNGLAVVFNGAAGDDVIRAARSGAGTNVLDGGANGTAGDTLDYGWLSAAASLSITLSAVNNTVVSAAVTGPSLGSADVKNFENVIGGAGNDTITGSTAVNVIEGGKGADKLTAVGSGDTVSYTGSLSAVRISLENEYQTGLKAQEQFFVPGDDVVNGDAAGDILAGGFSGFIGSGFDDIVQGNSTRADVISGRDGNDDLSGGAGNFGDTLDGGAGNDTLSGGDGADKLFGGTGADTFIADLGGDTIDGGTGVDEDVVDYSSVLQGITVALGANGVSAGVTTAVTNAASGDALINIEYVIGSGGNDKLTGNNLTHRLDGGSGNDTLIGGSGASFLSGGEGDDTIFASVANGGLGGDKGVEQYSGGNDFDTLSFVNITTGVSVDFATTIGSVAGTDDFFALGFENVIGTTKDDVFVSNDVTGMKIDGAGGNDSLVGDQGTDHLIGGAGNDFIRDGYDIMGAADDFVGGADIDAVSYLDSNLAISINLARQFNANATTGVIVATAGAEAGSGGGAAGDRLSGIENVTGGNAEDTILGNAGVNVIEGLGNADKLFGGAGIDTVSYKFSDDEVTVDLTKQGSADIDGNELPGKSATSQNSGGHADGDLLYDFEIVVGSNKGDTLSTGALGSTLYGGKGSDTLIGSSAADTLYGEDDHDSFASKGGADKIYGGSGTDTVYFTERGSGVTVALNNSAAISAAVSGGAAGMQIFDVEWLYADSFNAHVDKLTGNDAENWFKGEGGNDTLSGMAGIDTLEGGAGDDTLIGGTFGDILDGGIGFDTVDYSTSTTLVSVNLSDQGKYVGDVDGDPRFSNGPAQSSGDASGDLLWSIERVVGSATKGDTLTGSKVDLGVTTVLDGNGGDDFITAGLGAELLVGGLGIDTISFENSGLGVIVNLNQQGTYSAAGNAGKGSITGATAQTGGDAAGDFLSGFENVSGSTHIDTLIGSSVANRIYGNQGADTLTGNGGNDTFVFKFDTEGSDTITDFNLGDKLEISKAGFGIAANLTVATFNAEYFVANANGTATFGGHGQFVYNTTTDNLYWDADGTGGGAAELVADLTLDYLLKNPDFTLVL